MKEKINLIKKSTILVFKRPVYIFLAAFLTILIFFLFIFLTNIPVFLQTWTLTKNFTILLKLSANIIDNILFVSGPIALALMIAVSIFSGINISMITFQYLSDRSVSKSNFATGGGVMGSAFGAGCPACSTSILSLLGVSGGLGVLPFKGIEITSFGLLILLISFYFISKSINSCKACQIK